MDNADLIKQWVIVTAIPSASTHPSILCTCHKSSSSWLMVCCNNF